MQPLLLLHGAIGASAQLQPLAQRLNTNYTVYTLDFSGHGSNAMPMDHFSMPLFTADVLKFMDDHGLEKVSIFGYSMGGYVAMYLAKHYSDRVNSIITLATKYHWDESIAAKEVQMLNPENIEQKLPAFAETLKQRHFPGDWKEVLKKTAEMMLALGSNNVLTNEDYASIATPALILLGDRDKMVSLEETVTVYIALSNAQFGIIPNTPHPIEQVNPDVLSYMIVHFLG